MERSTLKSKKEMKVIEEIKTMKKSWKMAAIITGGVIVVGAGGYFGYSAITKPAVKTTQYMKLIEAVQGTGDNRFITAETSASSSTSKSTSYNNGYSSNGNTTSNGTQRTGGSSRMTSIASTDVTRKKVEVGISNQNYI